MYNGIVLSYSFTLAVKSRLYFGATSVMGVCRFIKRTIADTVTVVVFSFTGIVRE